jgi:ribonucleoside-diphosphate reductase beta chain
MEPLLDPNQARTQLFPIRYPELWKARQDHKASFWTAEELDLRPDMTDWEKMTPEERHYISTVLAFFGISDFIVTEHLETDFVSRITIPEAQMFYQLQTFMESEHTLTYALLLETYITDAQERSRLLNGVKTIPTIGKKVAWCKKWMDQGDFVQRLVAFSMVEGIFFSGSFCSIFWLKKRGLMPGLTLSNQLIARDEGMHRDFACLLYRNYIVNKLPVKDLYEMLDEAIQIEKEFVCECLPVRLIGMNQELMCQYIDYVAEHLLLNLTSIQRKQVDNPFDWMVYISLENKTNFFEHRPTEYSKAGSESTISFHDEF